LKRISVIAALTLLSGGAAATDVGVSVSVSQPGVYGRVDIGRFPQPQVVVAEPVIVQQPRVVVVQPAQPVYLYVPPGHRKHWRKHCHRYDACGSPVYFVRHDWYHRQANVGHHRRYDAGEHAAHHGHGRKGYGRHKHDD
jgi:hypothetical protein